MSDKIAIYPGTFDPLTFGHLDILERACILFDKVILAIADNSKKSPLFQSQERVEIAKAEIKRIKVLNVEIMSFNTLLVDFAKSQKVKIIIRGIRAVSDFEYEFQMAYINKKLFPELETIFLPASEKSHFISATLVKEVAKLEGDLNGFVSKNVAEQIKNKFN
ncbi:MAG: pantetheine-phosphate adenylyltransferase [Candidatus Midichloria sp.]|nr:MAG: pantetheine-phosphate adenylyltransferase [Candidatus Midichloria sp.]